MELARAVGPEGKVIGIDPSEDIRGAAVERCKGFETVEILEAGAVQVPLEDECADKAASIQVCEYIDDLPVASKEVFKLIRRGGRTAY